jgi:hypothetical protein
MTERVPTGHRFRSFQFGLTSAPIVPHFVQAIRGPQGWDREIVGQAFQSLIERSTVRATGGLRRDLVLAADEIHDGGSRIPIRPRHLA